MPKTTRTRAIPATDRSTRARNSRESGKGGKPPAQPAVAGRDSRAEDRHELLEVQGFDLMAQIEAMLRHAREYQREVQRLRGILGKGQTATAEMNPLAAVRHHIERMRHAYASFGETLTDAVSIVDSLEHRGDRK
jgi:hypothetical protein